MKVFNSHEELGEELKKAYPEQYRKINTKQLGLEYAKKNPEAVRIKGFTEAWQTQDVDFDQLKENILPSVGNLIVETGEGLYDVAKQVADPNQSFLANVARIGAGGIDVLGRKMGADIDLASPQSEEMASLIGGEISQSLTPAGISKDPAGALANLAGAVSLPLRGTALAARGAKLGKAASVLSKVADKAESLDPTVALYRAAKYPLRKAKEYAGSIRRPDKGLASEYVDETLGYSTSAGPVAIAALREIANEGKGDLVRSWRNQERTGLYTKAFDEIKKSTESVNKQGEIAYKRAMNELDPLMSQNYGLLEKLKSRIVADLQEKFGDGIQITTNRTKRFVEGQAGSKLGEVEDVAIKVNIDDASGVLPEFRGVIAKELEEVLNWQPGKTGKEINDWRKQLDKKIQQMDGPADFRGERSPSAAAFNVRTTLRKAIQDDIKETYGQPYIDAMAEYERIAELKRNLQNTFSITGTTFDKVKREQIVAELYNAYNQNPRQHIRPELLKELEDLSGNPNIRAMTLGGLFNPFVSKGLAQRAEISKYLRGLAAISAAGITGDVLTGALTYVATFPLQLIYNPRAASEIVLRASKGKPPGLRNKISQSYDTMAFWYKSLPDEVKSFIQQLPPNTPMNRALERVATQYDLDVADVQADEQSPEGSFLKTLSKAR